jgi:hypothetical protein
MKLFNKIKQFRYGTLEFTFPDERKLYRLKEEYFQKLPAEKILDIQANNNSIAFLGVAKDTLANAVSRIIKNSEQALTMLELDQDPTKKIGETLTVAKYIDINVKEHERIQEHIVVSIFDMFFFFEGESYFEKTYETMELKRHYLKTYPYFNTFFFQKVENYLTSYGLELKNCTRTALVLSTLQSMSKALTLKDMPLESVS